MVRFLIGLDPSFSNTGIAILDLSSKSILLDSYGDTIGEKTYQNLFHNVQDRCLGVSRIIKSQIGADSCLIISETPPANGNFAAGLFALDVPLHLLLKKLPNCEGLYGLAPTYLGHLHGTRSYKKSDSVKLCRDILSVFEDHSFKVNVNGRLSADMAEAFLFLVRLYVLNFSDFIGSYLKSRHIKYFDKKEFEL